jgi:hypothetical protein
MVFENRNHFGSLHHQSKLKATWRHLKVESVPVLCRVGAWKDCQQVLNLISQPNLYGENLKKGFQSCFATSVEKRNHMIPPGLLSFKCDF